MSQAQINEFRLDILKLLEQYKFLTTSQLRQKLAGPPPLRSVQHALSKLRGLDMIRSFPVEPELGRSSELCWQLRPAGSRQIGFIHNSHYSRRPSRERIAFRTSELELSFQTEQAGWQLIVPTTHSPSRPLPKVTQQYSLLAEAVRFAQYYQLARWQQMDANHPELKAQVERFNAGFYKNGIPERANDFVAYYESEPSMPNNFLAVVLIPCPPDITNKFWSKRIEQYGTVAKLIKVFGIFKDEAQANTHKNQIKAAGLRVTSFNRVRVVLEKTKIDAYKLASEVTQG